MSKLIKYGISRNLTILFVINVNGKTKQFFKNLLNTIPLRIYEGYINILAAKSNRGFLNLVLLSFSLFNSPFFVYRSG